MNNIYKIIFEAKRAGKFVVYHESLIPSTARCYEIVGTLPDGRKVIVGEFKHDVVFLSYPEQVALG